VLRAISRKARAGNYLHIAQASLSELDTQIEIALQLDLLPKQQWMELDKRMNHIDKLLSGLLKYLKSGKTRTPNPSPFTPH
jgi:four helix bundle protein